MPFFMSVLLLAPLFAIIPALAAPTGQDATVSYIVPSPTPGVLMDVQEWAKVQSYKTVRPWGGMGDEEWFFNFDSTYTSEAFAVTLWASPTGTYSGHEWTTNTPTATLSCNLHVTASPTETILMVLDDVAPYVPTPTVAPAVMSCTAA